MRNKNFKKEFEKRFIINKNDILRFNGIVCPEPNSYKLYKICFLLTQYEMKKLGYSISKAYKMSKHDIANTKQNIEKLSKTWKLFYIISHQ